MVKKWRHSDVSMFQHVSKTMQHGQKYYLPIKKEKLSKVSNKKNTSSETWSNKCHY